MKELQKILELKAEFKQELDKVNLVFFEEFSFDEDNFTSYCTFFVCEKDNYSQVKMQIDYNRSNPDDKKKLTNIYWFTTFAVLGDIRQMDYFDSLERSYLYFQQSDFFKFELKAMILNATLMNKPEGVKPIKI